MNTTKQVALLAPVPLEHLADGVDVCAEKGKVAFGSRAWEVFRKLDELRKGELVDVFIYASHTGLSGPPEVSWRARYIGHVVSDGGAHPDGMQYRPESTAKYSDDNKGYWAVFWEVESLVQIESDKRIRITDFCGLDKNKHYPKVFVPEGPLLIKHP